MVAIILYILGTMFYCRTIKS